MKVNVKRAIQQQKEEMIQQNERDALSFGLAIACLHLRISPDAKKRFGKKRLNELLQAMYAEMRDQFEKYRANETEVFSPETVPVLYAGLRNQILALDVEVEKIEDKWAFAEKFQEWRPERDIEKRASRYDLLQRREKLYRSFWYAFMLVLWKYYGLGRKRLNSFYNVVRYAYYSTFSHYLVCKAEDDARVVLTVQKTVEQLERIGVKV